MNGIGEYYNQPMAGIDSYLPSSPVTMVAGLAINGGSGYLVGRLIGYPVACAVATAGLGIVGMLGVAIYAAANGK